jgi:hypothetical protein
MSSPWCAGLLKSSEERGGALSCFLSGNSAPLRGSQNQQQKQWPPTTAQLKSDRVELAANMPTMFSDPAHIKITKVAKNSRTPNQ